MNISYKWLKEFINIDMSVEELRDRLTFSGIEVEAITKIGNIPPTVIVAEIIEKEKHPNADKLSVCKVWDGSENYQVVCGAPNCAAGQKVALALIGTVIVGDGPVRPDSITIKPAKIRGVESFGMLCSESELGLSTNHDGIMVLPNDAPTGQPIEKYLNISDVVYTVEITPNRPDLLGMLGVARDLSAQLDIPLIPQFPSIPLSLEGWTP